MVGREDIHGGHTKGGVHLMGLLALEIDDELESAFVEGFDLTEAPAAVNDITAGFHGLQLGFGRLERRVFGDECRYSFRIHREWFCESEPTS